MKKENKRKIIKCGFCNQEFEKKEIIITNFESLSSRHILLCPKCNCVLGFLAS